MDGGVEGLIHISEASLHSNVKLEEKFKLQDDVTAMIIKVDREERPDLDDIYMQATVAMNHGHGGLLLKYLAKPDADEKR